MGTRSITRVFDTMFLEPGEEPPQVATIYRQMDGYPSGHGADLAAFLKDITVVNGIGLGDERRIANGAGCLAAQLVCDLKSGPGGIYLYPSTVTDAGQDYEYHIFAGAKEGITVKVLDYTKHVLFDGRVDEFAEFCNAA